MGACPPESASWMPACDGDLVLVSAGQWWDAVKVPLRIGDLARKLLGLDTGAVIEDPFGEVMYWLVPPGTADGWELQHITVLGGACYLAVPPAHRTEGLRVRWLVPCEPERVLTDPTKLHAALDTAVRTLLGPREGTDW